MDQQSTSDGRPYKPIRFKEIVKECFIISKNINTSYNDVLNMTPTERNYMIEFLVDEAKQKAEMYQKIKAEQQANEGSR